MSGYATLKKINKSMWAVENIAAKVSDIIPLASDCQEKWPEFSSEIAGLRNDMTRVSGIFDTIHEISDNHPELEIRMTKFTYNEMLSYMVNAERTVKSLISKNNEHIAKVPGKWCDDLYNLDGKIEDALSLMV